MSQHHPRNVLKVLLWLSMQEVGKEFTASQISHSLKLTSQDIGNVLKWNDEYVSKVDKTPDNGRTIWKVIKKLERPKTPINMCKIREEIT